MQGSEVLLPYIIFASLASHAKLGRKGQILAVFGIRTAIQGPVRIPAYRHKSLIFQSAGTLGNGAAASLIIVRSENFWNTVMPWLAFGNTFCLKQPPRVHNSACHRINGTSVSKMGQPWAASILCAPLVWHLKGHVLWIRSWNLSTATFISRQTGLTMISLLQAKMSQSLGLGRRLSSTVWGNYHMCW